MTISMHAGVRPRLWKANFISEADTIGSTLNRHHCLTISDQNFIFISHDSGFADFRRKGANKAFIRISSDQHCGNLSSGIPHSARPIVFTFITSVCKNRIWSYLWSVFMNILLQKHTFEKYF